MNDRSTLSPAVASGVPCRTAVGRFATDTSPDSSPESRRWRFASRKLPFADESCRPVAAVKLWGKLSFNVEGSGLRDFSLRPARLNGYVSPYLLKRILL